MTDRGSATAEAVFAITAIVFVLLLGVAAGRVTVATFAVEAAARDAARQASIARTASAARANAVVSATASLNSHGVTCTALGVHVDVGGFGSAVGTPASVRVTVSCAVPLEDVAFPGLPGSVQRRATFISPLDPYRGRGS
ncbi:hypothetical protein [Thermoactinospora rubra]|uniref:hypothetical protein n=1 Tax=Thermoactinospora rubra TaxID=1088767 RepID=UPI000A11C2C1|nr:hypothetical protein [Thermoactinospora rubra]